MVAGMEPQVRKKSQCPRAWHCQPSSPQGPGSASPTPTPQRCASEAGLGHRERLPDKGSAFGLAPAWGGCLPQRLSSVGSRRSPRSPAGALAGPRPLPSDAPRAPLPTLASPRGALSLPSPHPTLPRPLSLHRRPDLLPVCLTIPPWTGWTHLHSPMSPDKDIHPMSQVPLRRAPLPDSSLRREPFRITRGLSAG